MTDAHQNAVGLNILVSAQKAGQPAIDLTGYTLVLRVWKPRVAITAYVDWPCTMSGIDSLAYVTESGDLDVEGDYKIQTIISKPDGTFLPGDTHIITVLPPKGIP